MATLRQRAQSLEPGVRIELFELDLGPQGGSILRFHNHTPAAGATIRRTPSETYTAFPIRVEGFEYKAGGILPRPHLFVSNIGSTISALLREYDDCLDCKLTRHVTFKEFVYAVGNAAEAGYDPTQEYPPDVFVVDRKVMESNTEVEFELVAASDMEGVMLPRRQIMSNICPWVFRGPECTYTGVPKQYISDAGAVASFPATTVNGAGEVYSAAVTYAHLNRVYVLINGVQFKYVSRYASNIGHPVTDSTWWAADICPKGISDCKIHFGANAVLPIGSFPGTAKLPQ